MDCTVATGDEPALVLARLPPSFAVQQGDRLKPGKLLRFVIEADGIQVSYYTLGWQWFIEHRIKAPWATHVCVGVSVGSRRVESTLASTTGHLIIRSRGTDTL